MSEPGYVELLSVSANEAGSIAVELQTGVLADGVLEFLIDCLRAAAEKQLAESAAQN